MKTPAFILTENSLTVTLDGKIETINSGHPGWKTAIECLKKNGTLAQLHEKWFGVKPEAGSAATELKTTATPDGAGFRVNGSKVFTTHSPYADVLQSRGQLTVFAPPSLDGFVISVDADDVIAPECHVAPACSAQGIGRATDQP